MRIVAAILSAWAKHRERVEEEAAALKAVRESTTHVRVDLSDGTTYWERARALPELDGRCGVHWKHADIVAVERAQSIGRAGFWRGDAFVPPSQIKACSIERTKQ